jgi:hypothetical protein
MAEKSWNRAMKIRTRDCRINGPISICILFLFFTSACKPEGRKNQLIQETSQTPTLVHTAQTPRPTVTPPIKTPLSSSTPTPLASLTPFPTIPPDKIPSYVRDLMLRDDNCHLPCWWGIEPDKTSWEKARQFLGSFSEQFGDGFVLNIPTVNGPYTIIKYSFLYKISEDEKGDATFSVRDSLVKNIEIGPTGMEAFYPLSRLLSNLGSPDAINVATFSDYGSHGQLEFTILLKYDQIRASYTFEGEKIGNIVRACLRSQPVGPRLKLGEQLINIDQGSSKGILPIETATGIDVETFMLRFRDAEDALCLETPEELWP